MYEEIARMDFSSRLTKRIQNAVNVLGKDSPFFGKHIHHHSIAVTRIQVYKSSGWVIRLTLDSGAWMTHSCPTVTFEQQFSAKRFIEYVFERQVVFRGDLHYDACNIDIHSDDRYRPWFDE